MTATRRVLELIPNLRVDVVETSCCGMAGNFGYEAAHYDVSQRMAELVAAARRALGGRRHAAGGRRHQLPAPDCRRHARRRAA